MIRHIVWWTLKHEADGASPAENAARIVAASSVLHNLPSVLSVEVSNKIQPTTTVAVQVILTSTHKDLDALKQYQVDPVHVKFAKFITSLSDSRQCIDYELPD